MIFEPLTVTKAFLVKPAPLEDDRGFFARTWCAREFAEHGLEPSLSQCSISYNKGRGTLRGLHYQAQPHAEAKVVRCTRGAIFDVIVDLRPASPTYLDHCTATLTADNRDAVYVPRGCAHGFLTLGGRERGALPDVDRPRARRRQRRALGRPRVRHRMARGTRHHLRPRPHLAAPVSTPGREMHDLVAELYPLCRSITGDGVRETLRRVAKHVPLEIREVASGTQVFDWTVPPEWNIRSAHITGPDGRRVVDFETSNLHVMSYSVPTRARLSRAELDTHLHSLPDQPDRVPYRTSYYSRDWGFCVSERQRASLGDGEYEVVIDSDLRDGHHTYGELLIPGETDDEVLVSCHVCHPSLANDNLSGIAVATFLAAHLRTSRNRYSYRFLFVPGTIGAITWLSANRANVDRVKQGLVLACIGDGAPFTYKRSRRGDATIDRAVAHTLAHRPGEHEVVDFSPWGYDERQFCSPGFNLPVGGLTRSPQGRFPEYHTSADDLSLVRPEHLAESLSVLVEIVDVLEGDRAYLNVNPMCEPRLGARGLYPSVGGDDAGVDRVALLWVLNLSDGTHSLLDIAARAGLPFATVRAAADALVRVGLLESRP